MLSEEKFIKNLLSTKTMILSETPERWEAKVLKNFARFNGNT